MPRFTRYLGIDYSGAGTADTPLTGLRLFEAAAPTDDVGRARAQEHRPGAGRGHWTRRGLAAWVVADDRHRTAGAAHAAWQARREALGERDRKSVV
jgi:hypothetical protein